MPVQTNELRHWFVLTTFDPLDSEMQIRRENIGRESEGLSAFKFVVPAQLLKRRISHEQPEDYEDIASNDKDSLNTADPRNRESVRQNNEIRSALRRYLFIFGSESEISCFLDGDWNKFHHNRIQFFYDSERNAPTCHKRRWTSSSGCLPTSV